MRSVARYGIFAVGISAFGIFEFFGRRRVSIS